MRAHATRGAVVHTFVVLVHGRHAPEAWATPGGGHIALPPPPPSRNERERAAAGGGGASVEEAVGDDDTATVRVRCTTPDGSDAALSTLEVSSGARRGKLCAAIAHALHRAGLPVVGDRRAARERDALPRSCGALRRVTRLQLACVALTAPGGVAAERACPPALLATHWT
jgi:hypothetical protein